MVIFAVMMIAALIPPSGNRPIFRYDVGKPLAIKLNRVSTAGTARIEDVTYVSASRGRVPAYLIYPIKQPIVAAIEYGHWSLGDRNEFLSEAIAMTRYGIASLLPDAPFVRPAPWTSAQLGNFTDPLSDRNVYVQTVVDFRRGFDVIAKNFPSARDRIAFVGHSYDAGIGGNLAGADQRYRAFVLMAGSGTVLETSPSMVMGSFSEEQGLKALRALPKGALARYLAIMRPLDPDRWIVSATAPILMQFARNDMFVSRRQADQYAHAVRGPIRERWYIGGHEFYDPLARKDRERWLLAKLRIPPVATPPP